MTDKYTPEKVAELVAEAREEDWHAAGFSNTLRLMHEMADALTAVSAERDAAQRKARMIPKRLRADRDRLHKAITEALAVNEKSWRRADVRHLLRAALDKGENDDE